MYADVCKVKLLINKVFDKNKGIVVRSNQFYNGYDIGSIFV